MKNENARDKEAIRGFLNCSGASQLYIAFAFSGEDILQLENTIIYLLFIK